MSKPKKWKNKGIKRIRMTQLYMGERKGKSGRRLQTVNARIFESVLTELSKRIRSQKPHLTESQVRSEALKMIQQGKF